MKTFTDGLRFVHKIHDTIFGEYDVDRGDSLVLVESPDVELMDRIDPWNLARKEKSVVILTFFV